MRSTGPDAIVSEILDQLHERRRAAVDAASTLDAAIAELEEQARDRLADAGALLTPARHRWPASEAVGADVAEADRIVARMQRIDRKLAGWRVYRGRRAREALREERLRRASELRELLIRIATGAGVEVARDVPEVALLYDVAARRRAEAADLRRKALALQLQVAHIDRDVARHTRRQAERNLDRIRSGLNGKLG